MSGGVGVVMIFISGVRFLCLVGYDFCVWCTIFVSGGVGVVMIFVSGVRFLCRLVYDFRIVWAACPCWDMIFVYACLSCILVLSRALLYSYLFVLCIIITTSSISVGHHWKVGVSQTRRPCC